MNIRRGFFRIWAVLSSASVAIVFWWSYPQIKDQFGQQILSHDMPVECNLAKGKIDTDFYALDKNTPPVPDGFALEQSSTPPQAGGRAGSEVKFEDLIPGNICWYHPIKFRKFFPEYSDLSDDALRQKLYQKANLQQTWPHPWEVLSTTIRNAAIFPLIMLGLWFTGYWIVAGFRNKNR